MARNGSGDYSLYTPGNPTVDGQTITKDYLNNTLTDIGTEITDSLSRSNKGAMLAPLRHTVGAVGAPSITFDGDTTTGIYRSGASIIDFALAGVRAASLALGTWWVDTVTALTAATGLTIRGRAAATATGVVVDNGTTLTGAASRIAAFQNNTVDKLSIDKDGGIIGAAGGASVAVKGTAADGATAVGVVLDNTVTLANAAAKIASFKNNGTEKAYVDLNGKFVNTSQAMAVAWGTITLGNAGAATVTAGFNVTSASWATNVLTVTLTNSVGTTTALVASFGTSSNGQIIATSAGNTSVLIKKYDFAGAQNFTNAEIVTFAVFA